MKQEESTRNAIENVRDGFVWTVAIMENQENQVLTGL